MSWADFMRLCHNSRPLPPEALVEIEQVEALMAELERLTDDQETS